MAARARGRTITCGRIELPCGSRTIKRTNAGTRRKTQVKIESLHEQLRVRRKTISFIGKNASSRRIEAPSGRSSYSYGRKITRVTCSYS